MGSARLFVCARCRCQVLICSGCDRGQYYCTTGCAGVARRESLRRAGARYQRTRQGQHAHAARQQRYRERCRHKRRTDKVTHHRSGPYALSAPLLRIPSVTSEMPMPTLIPQLPLLKTRQRCHVCANAVSAFWRIDFLRTPVRRSSRRAPVRD